MENWENLPKDVREIIKEYYKTKHVDYMKNKKIDTIDRKIKGEIVYEASRALDAIDAVGSSIKKHKGIDFAIVIDRKGYEIKATAMVRHHLWTMRYRGLMKQYDYNAMLSDTMTTNEKYFVMHNGVWHMSSTIRRWYGGRKRIMFIVSKDGLAIRDKGDVMKMKKKKM